MSEDKTVRLRINPDLMSKVKVNEDNVFKTYDFKQNWSNNWI